MVAMVMVSAPPVLGSRASRSVARDGSRVSMRNELVEERLETIRHLEPRQVDGKTEGAKGSTRNPGRTVTIPRKPCLPGRGSGEQIRDQHAAGGGQAHAVAAPATDEEHAGRFR